MHGNGVTVVSASVGLALLGRFTGGIATTKASQPFATGQFAGFEAEDVIGYIVNQLCAK